MSVALTEHTSLHDATTTRTTVWCCVLPLLREAAAVSWSFCYYGMIKSILMIRNFDDSE